MGSEKVTMDLDDYLVIKAVYDDPRANDAEDKATIRTLQKLLEESREKTETYRKLYQENTEKFKLIERQNDLRCEERLGRKQDEIRQLGKLYKEALLSYKDFASKSIINFMLKRKRKNETLKKALEIIKDY